MTSPHQRIRQLDLTLFQHVLSQSTENDKRSFLAIQSAAGDRGPFSYLEIGSYRGGSIQPYLVDPQCERIISIDPRPFSLPDSRGGHLSYWQNSTQGMLEALKSVPGGDLAKLHTIEEGTENLTPARLPARPDICFIDGEHTEAAVMRDGLFCLSALRPNGCLFFHDVNIVYRGVEEFIRSLAGQPRTYRVHFLPDCLILVEFEDCRIGQHSLVRQMKDRAWEGYLHGLRENNLYRDYYNHPAPRAYRRIKAASWDRVVGKIRALRSRSHSN